MKRTKYSIRRNSIPSLALKDRTSKVWIDSNGNDVPWSGITSGTPISGTVIYNTTTGGTDNLIAGYLLIYLSVRSHFAHEPNIILLLDD